ncbi:MAG: S1 RNA-binding domain-containing protein [Chloroflexi bacterium]|nr:S1 RNA-binding domain-containing protein [Chloroflexota bacterium]
MDMNEQEVQQPEEDASGQPDHPHDEGDTAEELPSASLDTEDAPIDESGMEDTAEAEMSQDVELSETVDEQATDDVSHSEGSEDEDDDAEAADDDEDDDSLERGQIVRGTILEKSEEAITIDLGDGIVGDVIEQELSSHEPDTLAAFDVGDELYVYVLTPEDSEGRPQLSITRALKDQDWIDAEAFFNEGRLFEGKVAGYNKGGLIVRFGRLRGFVPASQIDPSRLSPGSQDEESWGALIGQDIAVKVIEVNRRRNRLILSERLAQRQSRSQRRAAVIEKLEVGQIRTGRVISLTDFGAFVNLGGVDGLVHLSELSWEHIEHPSEMVEIGQEVEVEVIHVDAERQRIGLSLKNRLPNPWEVVASEYGKNQIVPVEITKIAKFGAFARLVEHSAVEGLVHVSELSDERVENPGDVVSEGEILNMRIIRLDSEKRRLRLSLKQVPLDKFVDDDWNYINIDETLDAFAAEYQSAVLDEHEGEAPPEYVEEAPEPEIDAELPVDDAIEEATEDHPQDAIMEESEPLVEGDEEEAAAEDNHVEEDPPVMVEEAPADDSEAVEEPEPEEEA